MHATRRTSLALGQARPDAAAQPWTHSDCLPSFGSSWEMIALDPRRPVEVQQTSEQPLVLRVTGTK